MKLYSESDVRELLVFGMVDLGHPVRDYREAGEFIAAAERAIEERAERVTSTEHRLCGDRIVEQTIHDACMDAALTADIMADLRRRLVRASEGAGC